MQAGDKVKLQGEDFHGEIDATITKVLRPDMIACTAEGVIDEPSLQCIPVVNNANTRPRGRTRIWAIYTGHREQPVAAPVNTGGEVIDNPYADFTWDELRSLAQAHNVPANKKRPQIEQALIDIGAPTDMPESDDDGGSDEPADDGLGVGTVEADL